MGLLTQQPPKEAVLDGIPYTFHTDFRTAIRFETMILSGEYSDEVKIQKALELFYPIIPGNIEEAVNYIIWFYAGGKKEKKAGGSDSGAAYSFEEDDEYIYSAFLDQYGIDLQEVEYLHWWRFKAMFKALKEDNEIVKIIGYRAVKISSDMTSEQKKFYKSMKKRYRLKKTTKEEDEKLSAVEAALLGNGDLSVLIE